MTQHVARVIMGLFVTRNTKALNNIVKHMDIPPSELMRRAQIISGGKPPITAYKTNSGKTMPIGVEEIKKPKYGWINTGSERKPMWEKSSDPQTGVYDSYFDKINKINDKLEWIKKKQGRLVYK